MVHTNTILGALYEAEFQAEALRRNFVPHTPCFPMPWDFVVTCPNGVVKVQVKGTCQAAYDHPSTYKVMTSHGRTTRKQYCEDVDVVACWVDPLRIWYIIPATTKIPKCIRLYAEAKRSSSRFQKYREDWSPFYKHE